MMTWRLSHRFFGPCYNINQRIAEMLALQRWTLGFGEIESSDHRVEGCIGMLEWALMNGIARLGHAIIPLLRQNS